jgi:uncharacterized protein (TIGR01244 family)
MNNAVEVTEELTIIGQVRLEQLQQAVEEGFQSVLNLRSPHELGFWKDERQFAESLGLHYVNVPLRLEALDEAIVTEVLQTLEQLSKPVLVHCAAGMRSMAISLLSLAIQQGLTPEETLAKARSLGFHYVDNTLVSQELKQRFVNYIGKYSKVAADAA